MHVVGAGLEADDKQLSAPGLMARVPPAPPSASPHATNAEPILARNPFDSVTGPLNLVPISEASASAELPPLDMSDPFNAPDCDGVRVLIIAASADPDWSFAALETMANGNLLCQTQMFKPPPSASGTVAAAPAPLPAGGATPVSDDIKKGIQRIGPNEFNVDRGVVDKILENQAELMRQARIVPEQENGKVVGIRLFGVRADTLLGTLGMENGDRLEKINGFDMTSPEKALEAYARLRTADHLTISLNRKGSEQNLDYNIK